MAQLQQYALALDNPPLLIVSDMDQIRIHTNWTNTIHKTYTIKLDDLTDATHRDTLRHAFTDPERLKPEKTRQLLTEEAAEQFAKIAQRLRDREHNAEELAHFVNRLVFCMFAEDVELLPNKMFERMLRHCEQKPADFEQHARMLFGAMKAGGMVGFEKVDWFNGGLFDSDHAFPLLKPDIEDLLKAAKLDWSDVDPSILGTLFERGLDPDKRSQLGAHYTDREKIMMIVNPVIVEPLLAEWAEVKAKIVELLDNAPKATKTKLLKGAELTASTKAKAAAEKLHQTFLEKLKAFRVLDPACGSGNFLYISLLELKNIEHRVNLEAEALGLTRGFPSIGPEAVLGIELNAYAAELARVSVWIGEIQWMRRNGFDAAKNPILRNLDTIECRDAVLDEATGDRAKWPLADVVVGNPPFLGNKKMIAELGEEYTKALRKAWPQVAGGVDLVCYWFAGAWDRMVAGKLHRAGLVSTNSIRGGVNREVLAPIVEHGSISEAWSDEGWTVDGAAVRVSLICFSSEKAVVARLDGQPVHQITADLHFNSSSEHDSTATPLQENIGVSFQGPVLVGNFDIDETVAQSWLTAPFNPNGRSNADVLFPLRNGQDLTTRPRKKWVINFREASESDSSLYEAPFEHVISMVKPERLRSNDRQRREKWWRLGRSGSSFFTATAPLFRYIATSQVAKHRMFVWLPARIQPHQTVIAIARDDDTTFGILHSRFHELWSLRMGTSLEDRPRYTPSTTFETFPFPAGLTPNISAAEYAGDPRAQAIAKAAARLNELRENWLNPPDLIRREAEVVPGYPDRILPVDEAATKELAKRTLTNLYNARPAWLDHAHRALDEAVADAYAASVFEATACANAISMTSRSKRVSSPAQSRNVDRNP